MKTKTELKQIDTLLNSISADVSAKASDALKFFVPGDSSKGTPHKWLGDTATGKKSSQTQASAQLNTLLNGISQLDFTPLITFLENETAYIAQTYPDVFGDYYNVHKGDNAITDSRNIPAGYVPPSSQEFIEAFLTLDKTKIGADGATRGPAEDELYWLYSQDAKKNKDDVNSYIIEICQLRSLTQSILEFQAKAQQQNVTTTVDDFHQNMIKIQQTLLPALALIQAGMQKLQQDPIFCAHYSDLQHTDDDSDSAPSHDAFTAAAPSQNVSTPPPYALTIGIATIVAIVIMTTLTVLALLGVIPIDETIKHAFANFNLVQQISALVATVVAPAATVALVTAGLTKLGALLYDMFATPKATTSNTMTSAAKPSSDTTASTDSTHSESPSPSGSAPASPRTSADVSRNLNGGPLDKLFEGQQASTVLNNSDKVVTLTTEQPVPSVPPYSSTPTASSPKPAAETPDPTQPPATTSPTHGQ